MYRNLAGEPLAPTKSGGNGLPRSTGLPVTMGFVSRSMCRHGSGERSGEPAAEIGPPRQRRVDGAPREAPRGAGRRGAAQGRLPAYDETRRTRPAAATPTPTSRTAPRWSASSSPQTSRGPQLSRRPPAERIRQRACPIRGRRLVRRRLLGEPPAREAGPVAGAQRYTGAGHTPEGYREDLLLDHLLSGIEAAAGATEPACGAAGSRRNVPSNATSPNG